MAGTRKRQSCPDQLRLDTMWKRARPADVDPELDGCSGSERSADASDSEDQAGALSTSVLSTGHSDSVSSSASTSASSSNLSSGKSMQTLIYQ